MNRNPVKPPYLGYGTHIYRILMPQWFVDGQRYAPDGSTVNLYTPQFHARTTLQANSAADALRKARHMGYGGAAVELIGRVQ